ncbi:PaeR7I family type II restriction endonuclease [Amycolatopsis rubida]|uniref:Restriction endonuclease XhoI n=1 Tax=Amycolatopsis rubida TaxID=112413 RepID=A0A1I5SDS7_9PSEU|nr:PaeR7I family type II restriction endonuclease [Amycolatopsis rubida]SFP68647.1 Restriction endonuclease XhoI [Amycolatopsis rubida]
MSPDVMPLLVNWWKAKSAAVAKLDAQGRSGIGAQARDAKHMQSLAVFVRQMFIDAGLSEDEVTTDTVIPGYFRRSKNWDVVALHKGHLVGVVELKSQENSPGNNANNRIEEAIGSVVDAKTVQDISENFGKLGVWAAWCMTFNRDCEPRRRNGVRSKHFPLDPEFVPFSYASQYGKAIERLIARNLYQAGWMVRTWVNDDGTVGYDEPISTATAETLAMQIESRVKFAVQALRDE